MFFSCLPVYHDRRCVPVSLRQTASRRSVVLIAAVAVVLVLWTMVASARFALGIALMIAPKTDAVAFSPDGHILASGSTDHTVKLWNVASGTLLRTLPTAHTQA